MKHRTLAFMIIWGYLACALWLPLGIANVDWSLYFFPPGYFFALGGFIGLIGECLSHRWGRTWVVLPLLALSWELGIGMYGGHSAGLSLSAIFAFSTFCGYFLGPWLARFTKLVRFGGIFAGILGVVWLLAWAATDNQTAKARVSPDGAYTAWVNTSRAGKIRAVHVAPRYGMLGAFSNRVAGIYEGWLSDEDSVAITNFKWTDANNLEVATDHSGAPKTESPSVLLPIRVTLTVDRAGP